MFGWKILRENQNFRLNWEVRKYPGRRLYQIIFLLLSGKKIHRYVHQVTRNWAYFHSSELRRKLQKTIRLESLNQNLDKMKIIFFILPCLPKRKVNSHNRSNFSTTSLWLMLKLQQIPPTPKYTCDKLLPWSCGCILGTSNWTAFMSAAFHGNVTANYFWQKCLITNNRFT